MLEKVARCPTTRRLGAAVASSLCFAVTLYIAEQVLARGRAAEWRRSAVEAREPRVRSRASWWRCGSGVRASGERSPGEARRSGCVEAERR